MDLHKTMKRRFRYQLVALVTLLLMMHGQAPIGATAADLEREGGYGLLRLPPDSVGDVLLSESGQLAVVKLVAFDRAKGFPERLVYLVDVKAQRLQSLIALPAVSCCAFPVFSMTSDGQAVAVGGADRVELFNPNGAKVMDAALKDRTFNTALKVSRDGRVIFAGQSSGRITAFRRGRSEPLWSVRVGDDLLDLAVSGDGQTVVAATPQAILILAGASGSVLKRVPFGPSFTVAVASSRTGDRIVVAWKRDPWQRQDPRVVLGMLSDGRWKWSRTLKEGQAPLLQMDAAGNVGGGRGLSGHARRTDLRSRANRLAVGRGANGGRRGNRRAGGHCPGSHVEVRDPSGRRAVWWGTLPGVAHHLRLAGSTLAVLGSKDADDYVVDRLWLARIGAGSEYR